MPEAADNEIITFGCRLNAFESEAIRRAAAAAGLAGAVIVNTCAVTAEAERQARQAIRRARRLHPQAALIVTGCAAELAPERYAALPGVDRVLGNKEKLQPESYRLDPVAPCTPHPSPLPASATVFTEHQRVPAPLMGAGQGGGDAAKNAPARDLLVPRDGFLGIVAPAFTPTQRSPIMGEGLRASGEREGPAQREGEGLAAAPRAAEDFAGRCRAFLQVQQGCDHRCTFCIIPFARGVSRSVPPETVAGEARRLVAAGFQEIVLTGVDLTAYGVDLPGQPTLGQLTRQLLAAVRELPRLRLSSLDPAEIDPELWQAFAEEARLMPHLHLSLQAGDDLILKRMRRRHSRAEAIAAARQARALRPETALGADLIAGFPTESEDMFRRSLDLVGDCGLAFLHVFPYSARAGTPAARMPQLPGTIVKERAARLRAAGAAALAADLAARVGGETEVLVEGPGIGRAACYAPVEFAMPAAPGSICHMRLVASTGHRLVGVPVS